MDLSLPAPPGHNVNGGTPTDTYLGIPKRMHLPFSQDMADLIKAAGPGCFLYCRDIATAYRQQSINPADWSLVCFVVEGHFMSTSVCCLVYAGQQHPARMPQVWWLCI